MHARVYTVFSRCIHCSSGQNAQNNAQQCIHWKNFRCIHCLHRFARVRSPKTRKTTRNSVYTGKVFSVYTKFTTCKHRSVKTCIHRAIGVYSVYTCQRIEPVGVYTARSMYTPNTAMACRCECALHQLVGIAGSYPAELSVWHMPWHQRLQQISPRTASNSHDLRALERVQVSQHGSTHPAPAREYTRTARSPRAP